VGHEIRVTTCTADPFQRNAPLREGGWVAVAGSSREENNLMQVPFQ
jgi:hypothetical protein